MNGKRAVVFVLAVAAVGWGAWAWGTAGRRAAARVQAPVEVQPLGRVPTTVARAPVLTGPVDRVLYRVTGMSCGGCQAEITTVLQANRGVGRVGVDIARGTVTVEYDPTVADPRALAQVITSEGYPARYLDSGPGVPPPDPNAPAGTGGCDTGGGPGGGGKGRGGCCGPSPARQPT